jgi:hypothetical protein
LLRYYTDVLPSSYVRLPHYIVASVSCYQSEESGPMDTIELVGDYLHHLSRTGHASLPEVPGSDGLTTAYLFQGQSVRIYGHSRRHQISREL